MLQVVVVVLAIVGLGLLSGGFFPGSWAVSAVGLLWVCVVILVVGEARKPVGAERLWLLLLAATIGWIAASILWSSSPHLSLLEARRGVVYIAGIAVVILTTTRRSALHLVAAVWLASVSLVVYALIPYLLAPASRIHSAEGALLSEPLGYANAVGILAGIGAVLALGLAARKEGRGLRMAVSASVAPFAAALILTSSRGSVVALVAGVAGMAVLESERTRVLAALCVLAPVAAIVAFLSVRSRLVAESTTGAAADRAGYLLALAIVAAAAALLAAPGLVDRLAGRLPRIDLRGRVGAGAALAACALAALAVIPRALREHLTDKGYRLDYWRVAWHEYVAHPWLGSGAGTFGQFWGRAGKQAVAGGALDAHNLYLETLAEVGPIGLGLLVAMLALPLVLAVRLRGHPVVPVAAGGYLTLLVHAALDWDWEMPAVMLAGLVCGAAVVGAGRDGEPAVASSSTRAGFVVAALGLAVFSLVTRAV